MYTGAGINYGSAGRSNLHGSEGRKLWRYTNLTQLCFIFLKFFSIIMIFKKNYWINELSFFNNKLYIFLNETF